MSKRVYFRQIAERYINIMHKYLEMDFNSNYTGAFLKALFQLPKITSYYPLGLYHKSVCSGVFVRI